MKSLLLTILATMALCTATAQTSHLLAERSRSKPARSNVTTFKSVEQMPSFVDGMAALMKWIQSHLQYPQPAKEKGIQGTVMMQFVVTESGSIGQVKVVRSVEASLDSEATRLCKSLPPFIPDRHNSKPVSVWYTLPITFHLPGEQAAEEVTTNNYTPARSDAYTFKSVEQMPLFVGGNAALMKWIQSHMKYPASAKEKGIQGTVTMQFVVTESGNIGQVKVIRSAETSLDSEATRLCKSLPPFVPGRHNGKPVSVWYTLPITFGLIAKK